MALNTWVFVLFEMCASKNGVAAREIERKYGVTPRSAWFMTHRIREAMKADGLGIFVGVVVADETYFGGAEKNKHASRRNANAGGRSTTKTPVFALVHPMTGEVRSRVIPDVTSATLAKAITEHVDTGRSVLYTDGLASYNQVGKEFMRHRTVDHEAGEYVSREGATTNAAENFFSQLKRSIDGTHHHVSVEHLGRYLAEFDFRYSTRKMTDTKRVDVLIGRVAGRRLSYKPLTDHPAAVAAAS